MIPNIPVTLSAFIGREPQQNRLTLTLWRTAGVEELINGIEEFDPKSMPKIHQTSPHDYPKSCCCKWQPTPSGY